MKDGGSVCKYQRVCLRSCCMSVCVCEDMSELERRREGNSSGILGGGEALLSLQLIILITY